MFNNCSTPLTMPVAPISYSTGYGNGNNGFFGDGSWWAILILFALFGGWGNNGFGGFGGSSGVANEVQRGFDNQSVLNKLNGLENGLCDGFYSQNTTMLQGFNGLQQTVMNGFHGVDNAICTLGYQNQQGINNLSAQMANCCCETQRLVERGFADTNYNLATQSCDTRNTIQNATRDIIDNANCNTRSILDFLVNDKLSTLQAENQALKFKASQAEQNTFITANQQAQTAELIRRLGADCPSPAYLVPNPNCCYNAQVSFGNNCGCGNCY